MKEYQNFIADIITRGRVKSDRTGTGTVSAFGHFLRFDLQEGFPLVTVKRTAFKAIKAELLWFLEGSTDNERLHELGATIWDEWATETGDLGPIYGAQWRSWQVSFTADYRDLWARIKDAFTNTPTPRLGFDQIRYALNTLRDNPTSRRIVISGWNVEVLPNEGLSPQQNVLSGKQALPPCHMTFILNTTPLTVDERLELGVATGKFAKIESARAGLKVFLQDSTEETVDDLAHQWLDGYGIKRYYLNGLMQMRSC